VLEQRWLRVIQAPSGLIADRLFSHASQLIAHHWVNFVRIYAKYLMAQFYTGDTLKLMLAIITLFQLLISATLTQDKLAQLDDAVKEVASLFHLLPKTEYPIIFHLLVFHMPAVVRRWGSARNFWCFPYERSLPTTTHNPRYTRNPHLLHSLATLITANQQTC